MAISYTTPLPSKSVSSSTGTRLQQQVRHAKNDSRRTCAEEQPLVELRRLLGEPPLALCRLELRHQRTRRRSASVAYTHDPNTHLPLPKYADSIRQGAGAGLLAQLVDSLRSDPQAPAYLVTHVGWDALVQVDGPLVPGDAGRSRLGRGLMRVERPTTKWGESGE